MARAAVPRALGLLALSLCALVGTAAGSAEPAVRAERAACAPGHLAPGYAARVTRALRSGRDLWGEALLAAPQGPTYEGARRYLEPLFLARGPKQRPLTQSGVHYVAFAQPLGVQGAGSVSLHLADGSQIVSDRVDGRSVTILVGDRGRERFGSCLSRLATPRLAEGYLPILQTRYVDAHGGRYRQESFAGRLPGTDSLVSFVRLTVDTRRSAARATRVTLEPSTLSYAVPRGSTRTLYLAWPGYRARSRPLELDRSRYERARSSVIGYWEGRLEDGAIFDVPEERVGDAQRNLLIQNLILTWRYSIGNPYEQFSFPESVDVAQVLAEYGFAAVSRSILRTSLTRKPTPYPNWKMGERLLAFALHYSLHRDQSVVEKATPVLRGYVRVLGRQVERDGRGLLGRERYSSDIAESVLGLHSQAIVWQGLRAMGRVWSETGRPALAAEARRAAGRLEAGLRRAVRDSQRRLPDGSLFVPVKLLDREAPYGALTGARLGSYWNLVMPYALASGLFRPGSPEATGVLRYLLRHGSRLLGLVRAGAYALYREPAYPVSGTDQVYGTNVSRFLADNDEADQLVLSLYGQLAAGMTEGTFVAGEAASVAPLPGTSLRSMYLPPNGAANAAFLTTLRSLLVHETTGPDGDPRGLELAFATPRAWLRAGSKIVVDAAPTSFGSVSYTIESTARDLRVSLMVPERAPPRDLHLRLRLPRGQRITDARLDGRRFARFDRATGTFDLSGLRGSVELAVGRGPRTP